MAPAAQRNGDGGDIEVADRVESAVDAIARDSIDTGPGGFEASPFGDGVPDGALVLMGIDGFHAARVDPDHVGMGQVALHLHLVRAYEGFAFVDELVDRLIQAPSRAELVATTRAMDRVLLWGHYIVPHWYSDTFRIVHWDKFGKPEISAPYTNDYFIIPYTWWYDTEKAARLQSDN